MTDESLKRGFQITKELEELNKLHQQIENVGTHLVVTVHSQSYYLNEVPEEFVIEDIKEVILLRLHRKIEALTKEFKNL